MTNWSDFIEQVVMDCLVNPESGGFIEIPAKRVSPLRRLLRWIRRELFWLPLRVKYGKLVHIDNVHPYRSPWWNK